MFRRIVVGVDEHGGGRDAIALAECLRHRSGELTLTHVYGSDAYMYRGASAEYLATEGERATEILEAVRAETGVTAHLRRRHASTASRGLHELCELIDADLLVVGSSQRGVFGRVMLGDDTRGALDGAPCSLAVAPLGYRAQTVGLREVGVAYDASPESEQALSLARAIAAEHGAKLSAFQAVALPIYTYVPDPEGYEAVLQELLAQARGRIAALGGVEPHAAHGVPAEELVLYSASLDLLVMGSRGYGPLGRLVYGSVSRRLIRKTRCPLLIVPRGAREEPEPKPAPGRAAAAA